MISKTPWRYIGNGTPGSTIVIIDTNGDPVCGPVMFLDDAKFIVGAANASDCGWLMVWGPETKLVKPRKGYYRQRIDKKKTPVYKQGKKEAKR